MELNDLYLEFLFIVPIFEENEEHKRIALFIQTSFQKNILSFGGSIPGHLNFDFISLKFILCQYFIYQKIFEAG